MAEIDIESYISQANLLDVSNLADVNVNALDSLPVTPNIFDFFPDAAFALPETTPSPSTEAFLFNSPQDEEQCIHSPLSPGFDLSLQHSVEHNLNDLSELPTGDVSLSPALETGNNLSSQALDLDALLIPFTPTATTPPPNIKLESPASTPAPLSLPTPYPLIPASPEMNTPRYVPPLTLPEEPIKSIKVEYSIPKLGDFTTPLPSPVVEPSMPVSVISTPALNIDTTTPLDPAGIGDVSFASVTTPSTSAATSSTSSSTATPSPSSQSSKPKLSSTNKNRTRFTPGTVPSGNTHASRYLGYVTKYRELPLSRKSTDQEHVLGRAAQPRLCFFCRYLRKLGAGEEKEGKGKRGREENREGPEGAERARSRASSSGSESMREAHDEETATKHATGPIRHHHNHHRRSPGASGMHGDANINPSGSDNNGNATAKEILEKARLHPQGPREGHVRRTTFECRACRYPLCKEFCFKAFHES